MKGKMIAGHPDVPLTVGELIAALKTYPRDGRVTIWTHPVTTADGPWTGLALTEVVGLVRTGTNTDNPELETSEALRHAQHEQTKHFCSGPSCPGSAFPASEIAHPSWHAQDPRPAALHRFAEARRQLRMAASGLDAVLDDGESVWSEKEILRHVLDATAALRAITDLARHVSGEPLTGTPETLDEALDGIGAELTEKI